MNENEQQSDLVKALYSKIDYLRGKIELLESGLVKAKRPWVRLTEEEIDTIVDANTTDDHGYDIWCDGDGVAREVEAKLKEKNQ